MTLTAMINLASNSTTDLHVIKELSGGKFPHISTVGVYLIKMNLFKRNGVRSSLVIRTKNRSYRRKTWEC